MTMHYANLLHRRLTYIFALRIYPQVNYIAYLLR